MSSTEQAAARPPAEVAAPPAPPAPDGPPRGGVLGGLVRSARPQQWTKNVLVFAAPGTAGVLTQGPRLLDALIAFAAFCLAASGTYVLNDVLDRAEDLRHPRKRHRAIASGVVPLPLAVAWAAALFCAAGAVGLLARPAFLAVLAGYAILTLAYSAVLKHIAVVDIVAVGSGFLLRAIGGAVAVDVALSDWFLIVAIFGCIFLVTGKRHAEHLDLGADRGGHRRTLSRYPLSYLVHVRSVSAAVTIIAYCQWALARDGAGPPWAALSILPVVLGLFRYELLLEEGKGGMPDEVIRQDRPLQAIGLAWCVLLALQVYAT